ncbi:MAG: radical SAM protein [Endomicrobiia bacterium]
MQNSNYDGSYNKTTEIYEKYNEYIPKNDIFLSNKLLKEYELAVKKTILKNKPRSLIVKLSNFCNLRCIMCPQEKFNIQHIDKKIISLIIENLKFTEKIIWQGGEPLIIPYFKDLLINTSVYQHIHQIVITNFQEVNDEILDLLIKNKVNLIISIDGATKQTYEKIRQGASFNKLIQNIEKINNCIGEIFLQINFVVMRENYSEMIDMVDFAHKYKFKMITFIKQDIILSEIEQRSLKKEEINYIKENMPTIYEKAKEYGIIIENQLNLISEDNNLNQNITKRNAIIDDNKSLYCHLPWYDLTISYESIISANNLCVLNNEFNFENVSSIDNFWNSEALVNSRESIVNFNKKNCNDICKFLNIEYRKPLNF